MQCQCREGRQADVWGSLAAGLDLLVSWKPMFEGRWMVFLKMTPRFVLCAPMNTLTYECAQKHLSNKKEFSRMTAQQRCLSFTVPHLVTLLVTNWLLQALETDRIDCSFNFRVYFYMEIGQTPKPSLVSVFPSVRVQMRIRLSWWQGLRE